MRRRDKLKNIVRANILAEQRYLESKGVLNEVSTTEVKKAIQYVKSYFTDLGHSEARSYMQDYTDNGVFTFDEFLKFPPDVQVDVAEDLQDQIRQEVGWMLDEDSLSEGRTTRADIVVFSHLSDIPLDKANVRKRAEFIKFIIDKCDGDLNKDIDPDALWSEFSKGFAEGVLNEGSDTYFETLSAALDHVRGMAEKMGYELDEDAVHFQFGTGGISYGQTKSATIPLLKDGKPIMSKSGKELNRAISVSIYRMDSGRYELTAYKTF